MKTGFAIVYKVFFLVLWFAPAGLISQDIIKKNYAHSYSQYEDRYFIDTFDVNNVSFLFTENARNNCYWKINYLDSNLNLKKELTTSVKHYSSFVASTHASGKYCYLFAKTQNGYGYRQTSISLYAIYTCFVYDLKDSTVKTMDFFLNKNMVVKSIFYTDSTLYINGITNKNARKKYQVTFKVSNKGDVSVINIPRKEVCHDFYDCIGTRDTIYNLVFKKVARKEYKLCIEKIDKLTLNKTTAILKSSDDKRLYASKFYNFGNGNVLLAGTYYDTKDPGKTYDGHLYVNGTYLSFMNNFGQKNIKFLPFMKLKSFVEKIPGVFEYGKEQISVNSISVKHVDSLIFVHYDIDFNTYMCDVKANALRKNDYLPRNYDYKIVLVFDKEGHLMDNFTIDKGQKNLVYRTFNYKSDFDVFNNKLFIYELLNNDLYFTSTKVNNDASADNYKVYSFLDLESGRLLAGNTKTFDLWFDNYFLSSGMYVYYKDRKRKTVFNLSKIPLK